MSGLELASASTTFPELVAGCVVSGLGLGSASTPFTEFASWAAVFKGLGAGTFAGGVAGGSEAALAGAGAGPVRASLGFGKY